MPFLQHPPLPLPTLKQQNAESGRVYLVEEGEHEGLALPSITRILGDAPKPWLKAWQQRVGLEEAQRITQQAASRGTALHSLAEYYIGNEEDKFAPALGSASLAVQELWSKLQPWLDAHITGVYAQECSLFSVQLGAAGRTDLIADVDDDLAIVDFKNSRRPKSESGVQDYYLQGTFYACALFEMTGLRAKRIIFPVVSPDRLQIFETTIQQNFDRLRERIAAFYMRHPRAENLFS